MVQVARLAPHALGESSRLVEGFLERERHPEGGFRDRGGRCDLYYTVFGIDACLALRMDPGADALNRWLERFGTGEGLDLVHLCSLIRCRAFTGFPEGHARALGRRLDAFRAPGGGYRPGGTPHATAYAGFLARGARQDLGPPRPERKASPHPWNPWRGRTAAGPTSRESPRAPPTPPPPRSPCSPTWDSRFRPPPPAGCRTGSTPREASWPRRRPPCPICSRPPPPCTPWPSSRHPSMPSGRPASTSSTPCGPTKAPSTATGTRRASTPSTPTTPFWPWAISTQDRLPEPAGSGAPSGRCFPRQAGEPETCFGPMSPGSNPCRSSPAILPGSGNPLWRSPLGHGSALLPKRPALGQHQYVPVKSAGARPSPDSARARKRFQAVPWSSGSASAPAEIYIPSSCS